MTQEVKTGFPSHLIDPKEKGREWVLQFIKAMWDDYKASCPDIFYNSRYKYQQNKSYALGRQSIEKYKPQQGVTDIEGEEELNIDWTVIPIIPKFRRIAMQRIGKRRFNIVATPVDSEAKDETEKMFREMAAKLFVREQVSATNPELLDSPALAIEPGEATDMEELDIKKNYTHKHNLSIEAEQGIKAVFEMNNIEDIRSGIRSSMFDSGVAGVRVYRASNGAIKLRTLDEQSLVVGKCKNNDFSDSPYYGEIVQMTIADLKQEAGSQFSDDEYTEIAKKYVGRNGNPNFIPSSNLPYSSSIDKFKIDVLDAEFYSVNDMVFEKRTDRRGNRVFGKAEYNSRNVRKEKYNRISYKVVYRGCWVIDSNYIYNYGLCTNMKRAKSSLGDTRSDWHLYAPDLYEMRTLSMTELAIPMSDAIQNAWYKLQNAINISRPKGIMIEVGGLEDIPLGKGGKKLTPRAVLDLYNKKGTLVYRKMDAQGRATNYKPIEELENGLGRDVLNYWNIIQNNIQLIRDVFGMNEFTDGSTPDPKSLTTIANAAIESSNNSLYHLYVAEKRILESVANSVMLHLQDSVNEGGVGYERMLGSGTVKFLKLSPNLSLHEFGIFLEDAPTDEEKLAILRDLDEYKRAGLLEPEDDATIRNTDNIKAAQQLIAYRVKKRKEQKFRESLILQQENARANQEAGVAVEQEKQNTINIELQASQQKIALETEKELAILDRKYQYEIQLKEMELNGKAAVKQIENQGKKDVKQTSEGSVEQAAFDEQYGSEFVA